MRETPTTRTYLGLMRFVAKSLKAKNMIQRDITARPSFDLHTGDEHFIDGLTRSTDPKLPITTPSPISYHKSITSSRIRAEKLI